MSISDPCLISSPFSSLLPARNSLFTCLMETINHFIEASSRSVTYFLEVHHLPRFKLTKAALPSFERFMHLGFLRELLMM